MKNGRCYLHGGPSTGAPKGNQNNFRHGIYSPYFTEAELDHAASFELGNVENELAICRIRLARALKCEKDAPEVELDEVIEREGGGEYVAAKERKYRKKDFQPIIDKLLSRIESLEKTQVALTAAHGSDENSDDITRDDTVIAPDEPIPDNPIL